MGFTFQVPTVVGGTVLVIERIQSQNYVPGVSGWAIFADGDAEFGDQVVVRGTLITGPAGSAHIAINDTDHPNGIAYYSGNVNEVDAAQSIPFTSGGGVQIGMRHSGATSPGLVIPATIDLLADIPTGKSILNAEADQVGIFANDSMVFASGGTYRVQDLEIVADALLGSDSILQKVGAAWFGTAVTPLTGTWVDTAGSRFGYTKDATGRVSVRGRVSGGGAGATIVTLPLGYRPSSNLDFSMRSGTTLCGVGVSTGGVLTVTANLATASAGGINLDVITFPTL
jgi:hypothetical protein